MPDQEFLATHRQLSMFVHAFNDWSRARENELLLAGMFAVQHAEASGQFRCPGQGCAICAAIAEARGMPMAGSMPPHNRG